MTGIRFPSKLTSVTVKGRNSSHTVTLPEKELFRVKHIFSQHEYGIPSHFLPKDKMTIVDIGANVGLFALYMLMTTVAGTIHCFEPAPASIELLKRNIGHMSGVRIYPVGLTDHDGSASLTLHPENTGQNTLNAPVNGDHEQVSVTVQDAHTALNRIGLSYIDVLKIDTEGSEVPILKSLLPRLKYIGIVMLEYHSEADRRRIDQLLANFSLIGSKAETIDVGTLKYVNRQLLGKQW
jgi:FkbM family methyltransferase